MDTELAIDSYHMYRLYKDSVSGKGGVILYVHESLSAVECHAIQSHKFKGTNCLKKDL